MRNASLGNILIVDDMPENLRLLMEILEKQGYNVRPAADGQYALMTARTVPPDLIVLDVKMSGMDGFEVCNHLKADERTRDIPVIFISALSDVLDKVKGFAAGGVDYITKPIQPAEVLARVDTHLTLQRYRRHLEELVAERTREIRQLKDQLQAENSYLREEIQYAHNFEEIIGQSKALGYLLFKVRQVAPTDTAVLILGETGVGKELIARALHHASTRHNRPLVKVNCATLPAQLIESELFGHEKGAFTGATSQRIGRFELADGATVFLDEIGELPLELQPKLLRVLQDGEFERVGCSQTRHVDVRVIAATNRNLDAEVQARRFREDLYYRLHVYPLSVPPLRERADDIPLLVNAFVGKLCKQLGKRIETIPQKTMEALQAYAWPGNVRELANILERAIITTQDSVLRLDLPQTSAPIGGQDKTLAAMERDYIRRILAQTQWKIQGPHGAAAVLDMDPGTLRSRMRKLGIQRP